MINLDEASPQWVEPTALPVFAVDLEPASTSTSRPSNHVITVQTNPNVSGAVIRILAVHPNTLQGTLVDPRPAVWHRAPHQMTAEALAGAARIVLFGHKGQVSTISVPDDSEAATTRVANGVDGNARMIGDTGRPPSGAEEPGDDDNEAPETPLDEPAPTPVQDPPAEPDRRPYTVHQSGKSGCA